MKKIFITGCAKSGTTLLQRMTYALFNTWVIRDETPLESFAKLKPSSVGEYEAVVAKRSWATILSSARLTDVDRARQEFLIDNSGIKVINIIRDGRDVVKSWYDDWGLWAPFEWMDCVEQISIYETFLHVRYEDLLEKPNEVQKKIESYVGMESEFFFSDYPRFVTEDSFSQTSYKLRPIDKTKILKDKEFYKSKRPNDIEHFDALLTRHGYKL